MKAAARILIALGLALACLAPPASAATPGDQLSVLFPGSLALARHRFAAPPVQVTLGAPLPAELGFSITIPASDWCRVGPDLTLKEAQRLAGFVSPRGRSFGVIEVMTHQLAAEVSPADWLVAMLVRSRVKVLRTRPAVSNGGPVFEALGVLPLPPGSKQPATLLRVSVLRSGSRLFVVRCLAQKNAFAALVHHFAAATLLFKPARTEPPALLGEWSLQCLRNGVCFQGPARGRAEVPWPGRQVQEAGFNLSQQGVATGTLHVKAISGSELAGTACEQRIGVLGRDLARRGVQVQWTSGGIAVAHPNLGGSGCYYRGRAMKGGEDLELFVFSWNNERAAVVVWMLSVGQITNLPAYLQNKRAFELTCRSLKLSGG